MTSVAGKKFFSHAHRTGVVLHNPAAALGSPQPRGFQGATLTLGEQRVIYRRWSSRRDGHRTGQSPQTRAI
ncbi:hypothetical protein ABZS94_28840 [Streptomyces sp. NPDC005500]|uniref:hypothetical protein n=1 Tax=Streptomyces sp. NPDC005500 TaxID=3155007 RepID=UPI0033AF2FE3